MRSFHRNQKGFTLVEIMIVVAIIALLAAIAIPNLLRARHNANETAAIGAVRTLSTALESYRAAQVTPSYPLGGSGALANLSNSVPPYVGSSLTGATSIAAARQGYYFVYNGAQNSFTLFTAPAQTGTTGTRFFRVDQSGTIRQRERTWPTATDPEIQ